MTVGVMGGSTDQMAFEVGAGVFYALAAIL
jgi:hypothetical protein